MNRHIRPAWIFSLFLVLFLAHPAARATSLARMSIAELAQSSHKIVLATCTGNSVIWQEGEIWTIATFDVNATWKGIAFAQIQVRLLGGSLGNITSAVSGVPRFQRGEQVVLFLQHTPLGDYGVVSWMQGTFRVHHSVRVGNAQNQSFVTQDTAAFATFDPVTRQFQFAGVHHLPLDSFHAQISAAVHESSGDPK